MKAYRFKTKFNYTLIIIVVFLTVLSCSNAEAMKENIAIDKVATDESYNSVEEVEQNLGLTIKKPKQLNQQKIIKSADVKYKVKDVKLFTSKIKKCANQYGGYISDLRFENNLHKKINRFVLKIPSDFFDKVLDSISKGVDFEDYEYISTKDVSEEYVDLQTRLKTKQEVKERYETILRKKATTVEDILLTEDKMRLIQEEIESAKGRLNYLTNKVSFSTIEVNLYETVDYQEEPISYHKTFGSKLKEALSFGWNIIESLFLGILYLWPILIIGILTFFYLRKKRNKLKI